MLFDSLEFLLFLPLVIGLYYLLPHTWRWLLLLIASYVFYAAWKIEFLGLIIFSTLVDYTVALQIEKSQSKVLKKRWLSLSLISNFGLLFLFKYFNFFVGSRNYFRDFTLSHPTLDSFSSIFEWGIPVGISFYTFQTVSYTLDVYHQKAKAEKHLGKFALFVSYFPQLVAGPIERFSHLQPQIFKKHPLKLENFQKGGRLILYGLFIKMVIADNLAPLVDAVFSNPLAYSSSDNWWSVLFFSIQIYADFNGYSLIAIGVAQLMGVELMDNFKGPYYSTSIKEFWSRWHISLSTWFRDYLYIPLGGNRVNTQRWMANILIVFILSGIWHGANVTFIVWGLIHGLTQLAEHYIKPFKRFQNTFIQLIRWGITTGIIGLAWVFFRAQSVAEAYLTFNQLFSLQANSSIYLKLNHWFKSYPIPEHLIQLNNPNIKVEQLDISFITFTLISLAFIFDFWLRNSRFDTKINDKPFWIRWSIYGLLIFCIMAFSGPDFYQFIYFQF